MTVWVDVSNVDDIVLSVVLVVDGSLDVTTSLVVCVEELDEVVENMEGS